MIKRNILLVAALLLVSVGFAQEVEKNENGPMIKCEEKAYDIAEIEQ
jgi:hypothetical protein